MIEKLVAAALKAKIKELTEMLERFEAEPPREWLHTVEIGVPIGVLNTVDFGEYGEDISRIVFDTEKGDDVMIEVQGTRQRLVDFGEQWDDEDLVLNDILKQLEDEDKVLESHVDKD